MFNDYWCCGEKIKQERVGEVGRLWEGRVLQFQVPIWLGSESFNQKVT